MTGVALGLIRKHYFRVTEESRYKQSKARKFLMAEQKPKDLRLTRRLMVAQVASVTGVTAAAWTGIFSLAPSEAGAQCAVTDSQPRDGARQGRSFGSVQSRNNATGRDPMTVRAGARQQATRIAILRMDPGVADGKPNARNCMKYGAPRPAYGLMSFSRAM